MDKFKKLEKIAKKFSKKLPNLQIQIKSDELESDFVYSSTDLNQQFHSASVGKLVTSIVIIQAIENEKLDWDTRISSVLEKEIYEGLFTKPNDVTVSHLLSHTSGVNDYFEGILDNGENILDDLIKDPNHLYTPKELLNLSRNHQKPIANPGEKFLYSDTGFVLLGLIAEKIYGKSLHTILKEQVFLPLEMKNTGLCFYDEDFLASNLAPVIVSKIDIHTYQSLSVDYAGGGLYTTTDDLTKLLKALHSLTIITKDSYQQIATFEHHFQKGMIYGMGIMELHFEEFFFLLKGLPRLQGHLGVLGVHAWFDPTTGNTYVINIGDIRKMVQSFKLLIQLVQITC